MDGNVIALQNEAKNQAMDGAVEKAISLRLTANQDGATENNVMKTSFATLSSQPAGASAENSVNESFYWVLTATLMLFVFALLVFLRRIRKLRQSAYVDEEDEFNEDVVTDWPSTAR